MQQKLKGLGAVALLTLILLVIAAALGSFLGGLVWAFESGWQLAR